MIRTKNSFLLLFLFFNGWSIILAQHIIKPIPFGKWVKGYDANDTSSAINFPSYVDRIKSDSLQQKKFQKLNEIPIAFFMSDTTGEVKQFEKLEIGIDLPKQIKEQIAVFIRGGRGLNPFNPEHISIEAEFFKSQAKMLDFTNFTHYPKMKNGYYKKVYGFYFEEFHVEKNDDRFKHGYWKKDTSNFNFRVRFAPKMEGNWFCLIKVVLYNETVLYLKPFEFICTSSNSKGFINSITEDNRHLQFENGEAFFGIGQNIPFADKPNVVLPTGLSKFREQPPQGYALQREYIEDLAKNGGNLVRIMHGEWTDAIEWEKLNDYSMNMNFAWEFDRTVDVCHENNIYILWLQQVHIPFMAHNPYNNDLLAWPSNPYHLNLGLEKPEDFFTDKEAMVNYKRKLRYMLSRWGYSQNIAAIQPMSEINEMAADLTQNPSYHPYFTDTSFRSVVGKWFLEIKNYIQKDLSYDFLVGSSFTGDIAQNVYDDPVMRIADINDYHPYGQNRNRNLGNRFGGINVTPGYGVFKRYQKPVFIGEMGTWDTEYLLECHENEFHNDIWGTAMLGAAFIGVHWHNWEDNFNMNLRANFISPSIFFEEIDFSNTNYIPYRFPEKNIDDKNYSIKEHNYFENLYMVNKRKTKNNPLAFGWMHNRSAYWYNYPETECEKQLTDKKTNDTLGKAYFRPTDDDEGSFTKYEGDENKKKRISLLKGLPKFKTFFIEWYDTETGEQITTSKEYHGIGKMKILIPDEINESTYQDISYKLYRKKDRPKLSISNPI